MTLPTLTPEQRAEALEKARISRQRRAEVKAQLKSGDLSLNEFFDLADNEVVLSKIKVKDVILSLPKIGKIKSEEIMRKIGVVENRRVRGLGSKQRSALIGELS